MIGGQVFNPGMGGGASAPFPRNQQGGPQVQANIQQQVPNQGQFNGNPNGAYNQGFMGQGNAPAWQQQRNLGRYRPPTMRGGNGQWNTNQWNDYGGYDYNLPGSYGSPMGGGQFAPMLNQFRQQFGMAGMTPDFFGMGNPFSNTFGGFGQSGKIPPNPDQFAPMPRRQVAGLPEGVSIRDFMARREAGLPPGAGDWFTGGQPGMGGGDNETLWREFRELDRLPPGMSRDMALMPGRDFPAEGESEADFLRRRIEELRGQNQQPQPTPPGKDGNPLPAPMPAPLSPRDPRQASPGWSQSFLNTLLNPPRPPQTGGTTGAMPDPEGGLQNAPVAPMPRFGGRGVAEGFGGPDSDEARFRNLSALRALMGGG